jgi:predicted membrane GTPase involved in stress response
LHSLYAGQHHFGVFHSANQQAVHVSVGLIVDQRFASMRLQWRPHTACAELTSADGETAQIGTVFRLQGSEIAKLARADHGDIIAIAEAGAMQAGQIFATKAPTRKVHN